MGDVRSCTSSPRATGNPFGVWEAAFGLAVGFLLSALAASLYSLLARHHPAQIGTDMAEFVGLWAGFVGAAVVASRTRGLFQLAPPPPPAAGDEAGERRRGLVADYGLRLQLWPDVPLGLVIGVASQYLLVPLLELPLRPFVQHLGTKLGRPAQQLLSPVQPDTAALVVLTVLICLGSPFVEELFFRGLLLRGLLGRLGHLGRRAGPALAIVLTGLVFGLVHFETLQFLGLAGFGMVLAYVAYRTGRLGPTILAHAAFNTTTVVAFVLSH